jgi:Na+-translocating ferredoxin:NAD+ oxidoreductase RnfE subunit
MSHRLTDGIAKLLNRLCGGGRFAIVFAANSISQLGNSLQFVAVLWFSSGAGPLGIVAVRVADTLPALLLGWHAGVVADRRPRRQTLVVANLAGGAAAAPLAVLGFADSLPVWALAVGGFAMVAATTYATPALGAIVPALVGRSRVQRANALIGGSKAIVSVAGQALAALLLMIFSPGAFFAINALSFIIAAILLARLSRDEPPLEPVAASHRHGFRAVALRPGLTAAITTMAVGTAVMTGIWTVGLVELARARYGGPAALSLLLMASAIGAIAATAVLAHISLPRVVLSSVVVWLLLPIGYATIAYAPTLAVAMAGTAGVGAAAAAALVLVTSAAQASVPRESLGRVLSLIYLANVGSKPVGLIALGPLFTVVGVNAMFDAGGALMLIVAAVGAAVVARATRRYRAREAAMNLPTPA